METIMNIEFNADLFRVVYSACSKEKARYYLNGVFITPAPNGQGVHLVATDGHRMLVGYDPEGSCNVAGCILQTEGHKLPPVNVFKSNARDGIRTVHISSDELATGSAIARVRGESSGLLGTALIHAVDGTFPDYFRVIPRPNGEAVTQAAAFNAKYIQQMAKAGVDLYHGTSPHFSVWSNSPSDPALVRFSETAPGGCDLIGIIMPLRANESAVASAGEPAWVRERASETLAIAAE
jgi:hypothetical protein